MRPSLPSKSVRGGESGSSNQLAFHFVAPIELVHDERPLCADTVEKVENRTAPKISRKVILSRIDRCNAP
jgi:hypothetical protein